MRPERFARRSGRIQPGTRAGGPATRALLAVLAAGLSLPGCLTTTLVADSRGEIAHQARITAIRSAWIVADTVVLQVDVKPHGRRGAHGLQFHVPVGQIGTWKGLDEGASYEEGPLKLEPSTLGCFEPAGFPAGGGAPMPIRGLWVRDYSDLDPALRALPVGVHVVAVRFDRGVAAGQPAWTTAESQVLDRKTTTALVVREADGSARNALVWGFDEQSRKRGSLLLLAPLSVAGDILTFPFQLIAMLMIDC